MHAEDLKKAYQRAFPAASAQHLELVGMHSLRRTMATLLFIASGDKHLVAAAGHWKISNDAIELYFKTAWQDIVVTMFQLEDKVWFSNLPWMKLDS